MEFQSQLGALVSLVALKRCDTTKQSVCRISISAWSTCASNSAEELWYKETARLEFQFQLEALVSLVALKRCGTTKQSFCVISIPAWSTYASSSAEELWYNETAHMWNFNLRLEQRVRLAALKSCDTTKPSVCGISIPVWSTCEFGRTEEFWYNETVRLWMTMESFCCPYICCWLFVVVYLITLEIFGAVFTFFFLVGSVSNSCRDFSLNAMKKRQ